MRAIAYQAHGDKYSNNDTRAIDSQKVIAPQYGMVGAIRPDPSNPPRNSKHNATTKHGAGKPFRYDVRRQRTSALKRDREILEHLLSDIDNGKCKERLNVVNLMRQRLKLMSTELAQRNLRDLAGGKMHHRGSFYSLGARARAA